MTAIRKVTLTLGLKYDGAIPIAPPNRIGHLTSGPNGFLRLLEAQLGIPGVEASLTSRLIQYLACLEDCNGPDRFYHASYQADPFSVARTLLQWRDDWYLAGWNGTFQAGVPARLSDMAAVELKARTTVALNRGQRIQRVLARLDEHHTASKPAIDRIELADPLEHFNALWQTLIRATGAALVELDSIRPQAPASSDLGKLQRHLLRPGSQKTALQHDGSLVLIEASSARESAPLIAHLIQQQLTAKQSLAVLCESRGELLDEALESAGACRLGFTAVSPWRPVFQVLPLALELLWAPLSASALLRFLSHPVGPIPARIRARLAQCVADTPGIGSAAWQRNVADALARENESRRRGYLEAIDYWLDSQRYDPQTGISAEVLADRAGRVLEWLMGVRAAAKDADFQTLYAVASNQVTEFIAATERLAQHGNGTLTQDNVRRLIDDVRGTGVPLIDRQAQVQSGQTRALRAEHAGSFNTPVQQTLWWDAQASDSIKRWPWTRQEREALTTHGVQLQQESHLLGWLGTAWARPLLAARERCLLVVHEDANRRHPIIDQISSITDRLPIHRLGDAALQSALAPQLAPLEPRRLPAKQRWWQLPENTVIPRRERESFSSLDALIYSPYQWLLNYGAQIHPGSLTSIADGNLLKGNLAHRLIERYFKAHADIAGIAPSEVAPWIDEQIYDLLQSEGATLLESGNSADCERFIAQMKDALLTLVEHLQQAKAVRVETELMQAGNFAGGELTGYIDLLATLSDGTEAVVDIKWGGGNYRRKHLQTGNYLQLAIYAFFRHRQAGKPLPALSYFVLKDSWMLNLNHHRFPNAESVAPANEENWGQFWLRFETSWRWRRQQLDAGLIEVTVQNTEPTEQSSPGEDGLERLDNVDAFNDYVALTGWEAGA